MLAWTPHRRHATRPERALLLLAVLLGALVGGCAVAPPRPEPIEPPPAGWTAVPPGSPGGEPSGAWWVELGDPALGPLIERALAGNRDLRAAAARVEASAAQARAAGAALSPQVAAALDLTRQRRNFIGFPIPGSERGVLSTTTGSLSAALSVSWEADLWGRLRSARSAAEAGVEAAAADFEAARLSLAARTAGAWFSLVEAEQQTVLAEATLENRRRTRQQIERRYRSGVRGPVDLRLARAAEASAEALAAQNRLRADAAARALDLLLSRYPAGTERAAGRRLPEPPGPIPVGLPADLVTRRPDLRAAERRLAAAGLEVARARAALYPTLRLTGSAGRLSEEVEDLLDDDFSIWSLAASLLQPIFQGGRLRAGVELSAARFEEAAQSYAQRLLVAFAEVENALVSERLLADQEAALGAAAREAGAARRLAESRYERGVGDYLSVLEAQRQSLDAESRAIAARRARLDARIALHLALGGGFDAPSPQPVASSDE